MKKRISILAVLLLCITMAFGVAARADFGDFSGDSDYGGGSDWGSSDWGSSGWDSDYDTDYGGGYYYIDSGIDGDGGFGSVVVAVIVIAIIVMVILLRKSKNGTAGTRKVNPGAAATPQARLRAMDAYRELDPNFNPDEFESRLSNLYVQLQNCWSARDLEPLRPYLTNMLYEQSERQVGQYRKNGQTPHVERIAVLGVDLRGWYQQDSQDHVIANVRARIVEYTTDDNTGEVVRGSSTEEKFLTYEWDLCRTSGKITYTGEDARDLHCPNCGAPMSINQSAKCPYCDSVVTVEEHDWVLAAIKGISQRTD